jgi:hypothetical protein
MVLFVDDLADAPVRGEDERFFFLWDEGRRGIP